MPRADPVKVDDMVFLLVPVLAEQAAEVGRAHREHQRVRRQKLWRGNIFKSFSSAIVSVKVICDYHNCQPGGWCHPHRQGWHLLAVPTGQAPPQGWRTTGGNFHLESQVIENIFFFRFKVLLYNYTWWWSCHLSRNSSSDAIFQHQPPLLPGLSCVFWPKQILVDRC